MILVAIGFTICSFYVLDYALTELLASIFPLLYFEDDEDLSMENIEFVQLSTEK